MRKRLALVAVTTLAAVGFGFATASSASATIHGVYATQAQCEAEKSARGGRNSFGDPLRCDFLRATNESPSGWYLTDNRGGG